MKAVGSDLLTDPRKVPTSWEHEVTSWFVTVAAN